MRILPVIDLKQGQVVRGVQGERELYRPVISQLTDSSHPRDVAAALANRLAVGEVYVADLDAIGGGEPDWVAYQAIAQAGLNLYVDAGAAAPWRINQLLEFSQNEPQLAKIIVALETLSDRSQLDDAFSLLGAEKSIFSLDLKQGRPFTACRPYVELAPLEIVKQAVEIGFQTVVVIDLANVGADQGPKVAPLCHQIRNEHPNLEIFAGGGVRDSDDLRLLAESGCDAALVASALHDGRLTREEIAQWRREP